MSKDRQDFIHFMKAREQAAQAYVNGDAGPLSALSAGSDPASFFHPKGDVIEGHEAVSTRYAKDAEYFQTGSETHFEILQLGADQGLAYWVGYQHAKARMAGQDEPIPMRLRITEVFRREGKSWKLVHRHADSPAPAPQSGLQK